MRALMMIAGTLALALPLGACSNNDQTDNTQNIDENLSAQNIVSNDVTAIDAVTGDAANMAADVEFNDVDNSLDNQGNASAPSKPASRPAAKAAATTNSADAATNSD
jgi:hypothetical protein